MSLHIVIDFGNPFVAEVDLWEDTDGRLVVDTDLPHSFTILSINREQAAKLAAILSDWAKNGTLPEGEEVWK